MNKKRFLQTILFFTLFILVFACTAQERTRFTVDTLKKVDTSMIIPVDVDADRIMDTLKIRLLGDNWKKPFLMIYRLKVKNKMILNEVSDNAMFDADFGQCPGMEWCSGGYLSCKKTWYQEEIFKRMVHPVPLNDERRLILFDSTSEVCLEKIARQYYIDSLKYSREKSIQQAKQIDAFYKTRAFVYLEIPVNPIYTTLPRVYDPFTRHFIVLFGL
jgi:hypothetical protein